MRKDKRIGHVTTHEASSLHDVAVLNHLRTTNFKWQRGRKLGKPFDIDVCTPVPVWNCLGVCTIFHALAVHITVLLCFFFFFLSCVHTGKGRFGQVYECFNLDTGEINAVKQVC